MRLVVKSLFVAVVLGSVAVPASAGLVGFWEFDGDLLDSSGMGNHGSANWTVAYGSDRFGTVGSAIVLPGGTARVTASSSGLPTNTFSFGGWMKTSLTHEIDPERNSGTHGTSGQQYAFGARNQSTNAGAGVSLGINGISVYEHGSSYMPATAVYNPGNNTAVGPDWNHVMVVYQDRVPTIYLNAMPVHTGVQSGRATVYAPFEIGGGSYGGLNGSMDAVGVWDYALSPSEIAQLAGGGGIVRNGSFEWDTFTTYPGYISGNFPITHWRSNSGSAGINPVADGASSSPFANNGVIPDGTQVAFIQATTTDRSIEQTVIGLEPGERYVLTYRENARNQTGRPTASVTLGGQTVIAPHTVHPVGGANPYRYVGSGVLTATSATADLRFTAIRGTGDLSGDSSLLLDDIQILPAHLLFADNFSVQANSTDINPGGNDLPGRRSGPYRRATYTERPGTPADYVQVDHPDYPGALRLAGQVGGFNLTSVSPDVNFNAFGGPSHFVLEYSVKPTDLEGNISWAAAVVGSSSQVAGVNSSDGIGLLIRQTGGYQIFDGTSGSNVSKGSGTLAAPLDPDGWYDVRINYFVPEFDDVTRGGVSIFVDDALIYSAATDSGFANNHLIFMGYSEAAPSGTIAAHGFDNIRLWTTAIPEPSATILLAFGMLIVPLIRGRRTGRMRLQRRE